MDAQFFLFSLKMLKLAGSTGLKTEPKAQSDEWENKNLDI